MEHFTLRQLTEQGRQGPGAYMEFLRADSMSMGLYQLPAGGHDPQEPHTEDEVYVVVAGAARLRVSDREVPVQAGSVVFVPARVEHGFHTITDDLGVLVFFAPPEYTNAARQAAGAPT